MSGIESFLAGISWQVWLGVVFFAYLIGGTRKEGSGKGD